MTWRPIRSLRGSVTEIWGSSPSSRQRRRAAARASASLERYRAQVEELRARLQRKRPQDRTIRTETCPQDDR
jgi:hypothetical protein